MPIHIILGKPGSGKSMYATERLIKELGEGERNVVTNLPLRPDKLNEYLQRAYPGHDCRMVQRLKILTDEELREFWKFRGPHAIKADAPQEMAPFKFEQDPQQTPEVNLAMFEVARIQYQAELTRRVQEFQKWYPAFADEQGSKGVAYFLDEAHIAFNARDWATLGRQAIHYMSQHRKLGDVVWPITQSPGNLDKQFRSVAEDFTVLRNEYTAKLGIFRGRGRFVRRTYLSEPNGSAEPFETATFKLDVDGVASCYDTARGIGVHGNKADIGRRAKGIPIWTVIPAALVLGLACVLLPWALGKGVGKVVSAGQKPIAPKVPEVKAAQPSAPLPAPPPDVRPMARVVSVDKEEKDPWEGVTVLGVAYGPRGARVSLSDGKVLQDGDGMLAAVMATHIQLTDGKKLWFKRAEPRNKAQPLPRQSPKPTGSGRSPENFAAQTVPDSHSGSQRITRSAEDPWTKYNIPKAVPRGTSSNNRANN